MPHAKSETWTKYRIDCEQQPDEELAGRMEGFADSESKMRIARIVYENRQLKRQHDYQIKQIERQNRVNIFCAIVLAIATMLAALSGAYLAYTLQSKSTLVKELTTQGSQAQP